MRHKLTCAAEAKRCQFERQYSNDVLANLVHAPKWEEARYRLEFLSDLADGVVQPVERILRRELTRGTVEQIDEILGPAIRSMRDAWECRRNEQFEKANRDAPRRAGNRKAKAKPLLDTPLFATIGDMQLIAKKGLSGEDRIQIWPLRKSLPARDLQP